MNYINHLNNYFQSNNKIFRILPIILISILSLFISYCNNIAVRQKPENIRIAIIGNTHPVSPYSVIGHRINLALKRINGYNPLFVTHLGDMVCGGNKWIGIKEKDINRQFKDFFSLTSRLKPILYTVKGEMDLLNNSPESYLKYTKRKEYYSFNYGNIHFLILDTTDSSPGRIGSDQMKWLQKDLNLHKGSEAIFVFTHHPLFIPKRIKHLGKEFHHKEHNKLHRLFLKFPVKAVFSGHLSIFHKEKKDKILYVITGCNDYNKMRNSKRSYQYYIVDYSGGNINILPKSL